MNCQLILHDLFLLVGESLWPCTVLILAFVFRRNVRNLITSLTEAKIGDKVFKFGQANSDRILTDVAEGNITSPVYDQPKFTTSQTSIKWEKSANLFWLGNDLEWTAQTILRGAPKKNIVHGLTQCYHHSSELGLGTTDAGKLLLNLKSQTELLSDADLNRGWRDSFSQRIYKVVHDFGVLANANQPNFRPNPNA